MPKCVRRVCAYVPRPARHQPTTAALPPPTLAWRRGALATRFDDVIVASLVCSPSTKQRQHELRRVRYVRARVYNVDLICLPPRGRGWVAWQMCNKCPASANADANDEGEENNDDDNTGNALLSLRQKKTLWTDGVVNWYAPCRRTHELCATCARA